MSAEPGPEKKIIIDEDWKTQVEREKETLRQPASAPPEAAPSAAPAESPSGAAAAQSAARPRRDDIPPATFELLVTMLATQALTLMGQVPDPQGVRPPPDLPAAQHFIDLLAMLQKKTAGGLSADEARLLEDVLHQLRMLFVVSAR